MTIVVFSPSYCPIERLLLVTKWLFKHHDLQICGLKLNKINMSNFQPLEVVDRGSYTQPRVVENLNKLT